MTAPNQTEALAALAGSSPQPHHDLLAVLERIALALENGNAHLLDLGRAVEGVANRIEDVGSYL